MLQSDFLRQSAQTIPDCVALEFMDQAMTWRDIDQSVEELARKLVGAGLKAGQTVMILSENSPAFLILTLAIWRASGAAAIVHASVEGAQLDYALQNAKPVMAFAEREFLSRLRAAIAGNRLATKSFPIDQNGPVLPRQVSFAAALPEVDPQALAIIGYTSGTTGRPKPLALSHRAIATGTTACAAVWRITAGDRILISMPMSWLAGLIVLAGTAITQGATIQLLRKPASSDILDAIERRATTFFFAPTSTYTRMVRLWQHRPEQRSYRLRCCISGGEARNETIFREWEHRTGVPVLDSYGSSECWPFVTHDFGVSRLPPRGSSGKLVNGAQLRLIGADGRVVPDGEVGEAQGRAPSMMMCYWDEPELTTLAMTDDGWYKIGDYARVDDDGYVYVLGRKSDAIACEGTLVFPAEIEQVISELPDVQQVAAVGLPDHSGCEIVAVAVVAVNGASLDADRIRAHCASRLQAVAVPCFIHLLGQLPHNAAGKVLRRDLVPILEAARSR